MAANTKLPLPLPTNGVITASSKGTVGGNRKKQKRRAKQAARQAEQPVVGAGHDPHDELEYGEDPLGYGEEEYDYTDAEQEQYADQYVRDQHDPNGAYQHDHPPATKKNKKKKQSLMSHSRSYNHTMLPPMPHASRSASVDFHHAVNGHRGSHQGNIWNTSTQQERQNIKDFWLSLSEDDRKALLKIEKEAVLKKMKQQQKHSCSCSVCGRKRTAIEEELEVLYEGYYEELEQYAHHDHPPLPPPGESAISAPLQHHHPHPLATPPPPLPHHKTSHLREHLDDDDISDDEYGSDEVEYSDEEADSELDHPQAHPGVPDFFNFGSHLTVKDNLLTVADDLLKNDGRKFIEMMEQLAERRMQRETRSQYEAESHSNYIADDGSYGHEDPMAAGDEFDEEEESYASGEEYDEDAEDIDEMGGMTEEQRMQEGRRMFQIFAARMFEQRVLTAYREKVAAERQKKLLEELDDEDKLQAQREAKKQRDAQKKKDKKKQQQAAKAEEKAKRDAERAEEEARLREAEEKKQEEQRRKKDEQRRKREEEKKRLEEEKARKEAEKLKRQQEEQLKREENERKARELKAAEKARKEEVRKREREEREAREREVREKKQQEDRDRRDREAAKASAEKASRERDKSAYATSQYQHQPPQITKRPSQAGMVAVPGALAKQPSGIPSPHPSVATPAMPKATISVTKQRQTSRQGSHASSPKQTSSQLSSAPSKSSSPSSVGQQQHFVAPKTIMQKPQSHANPQAGPNSIPSTSPLHQPPIQPPPGMIHPGQHHNGLGGQYMGFPGFAGPHGPMMHGNLGQRGPFPIMTQPAPPPMGVPSRMPFTGMNGMPVPPPGMMPPQPGRGPSFPHEGPSHNQPPPGFAQQAIRPLGQTSPVNPHQSATINDIQRPSLISHSRQQSLSEKEFVEPMTNQPIARPAPIQRPSSVKPGERHGSNPEIDDLSRHLGSSALLDDTDDPIPNGMLDNRRTSGAPPGSRNITGAGLGQVGGGFGQPIGAFASPPSSWNTPSFGQTPGLNGSGWGSLPTPGLNSWPSNNGPFGANGTFGSLGAGPAPTSRFPNTLRRGPALRLAVCQACRQLSSAPNAPSDGYHPVDVILHHIGIDQPPIDPPPTRHDIEMICDTEGDVHNGGGEIHVRGGGGSGPFYVMWEPGSAVDNTHPSGARGSVGLGEIGSPMPSKITPAAVGFGAPRLSRTSIGGGSGFGSLGSVIGSSAPGGA